MVNTSQVIAFYKIFKQRDTNGDGDLNINEFRKILVNKGKKNLAEGTLKSINSSKDGKIDIYEFLSFLLEKPTPFKGKEEGENDDDYITRIQNRNEEYLKLINNSLQKYKTQYKKGLELEIDGNFNYFKKVFSKSEISDDYLGLSSAQKTASRLTRPTGQTLQARRARARLTRPTGQTSQAQRARRVVSRQQSQRRQQQQQPASRQESQFNIPLPRQPPSSQTPPPQQPSSSQTSPQTPRTKVSLNFISIKKKLKANFADRQEDLKEMKEGNSGGDVNQYIHNLCSTVNIKLDLDNLIPQEKKMLKLLDKINSFYMIIFKTIFDNKSFESLLQEKHQTNINNNINELCTKINNLIKNNNKNNNDSSYKKKILDFCNKLEEFLQLLQEIINGIKKDLKIKLFQEEYKSKSTLKSNTTDFFISIKTGLIKELKSHDNSIIKMIKNYYKINEEDPYIHPDINEIDINEFLKNEKMSLNSNQINTLFYLYDKIMMKQKAENSNPRIQAFKRLIYKHLTYEIENVLPVYEYLDPVKIYKE